MAWYRREDLEDRELRSLSPRAALSRRAGPRRLDEAEDPLRTAFQRDRDRIIHSAAFRRLQHKTQVVAAYVGDHYRSRLTHSLEVAQMARSVSLALRLNTDLTEAVALAHDLGHPPFGHVGEEALDELMRGHGGFRHNAQGARIVDRLEDRYGHGYGLNLTLTTRISLVKGRVPEGFPLSPDLLGERPAPLEAQVVDACDRIAYMCHDLDDGLRAGALDLAEVRRLRLWRLAERRAGSDRPHRAISEMIALLIHDLVESADAGGELEPRHGGEAAEASAEVLDLLRRRFYRSELVLGVMHQGRDRLRAMFEQLVRDPDGLPEAARARIDRDGLERVVCDYVAGMTDRFLLRKAGEGPTSGLEPPATPDPDR